MPKRPRQHQLESESRVAFACRLPSTWVVRALDQDYGIDAQVEVFDDDGIATGLTFLVQLKATDSRKLSKPPVLRFSKDKANYYRSLDLPTLVVLYHAPTDRMFVKWIHSWDPHDEHKTKQSCAFTFNNDSEWTDDRPQRLIAELRELRRIRSPRLRKPLSIEIVSDHLTIHAFEMTHVVAALRAAQRQIGTWLRFLGPTPEPGSTSTQLRLSPGKISVLLAGMHGMTIHTPEGYPGDVSRFVKDIFITIGLALHWHGHSGPGSQLIAEHVEGSTLVGSSKAMAEISMALAAAGRIPEVLRLLESLFDDREKWEQGFMCYHGLAATLFMQSTRSMDQRLAASTLERISETLSHEEPVHAATLSYNTANIYRGLKEHRNSIRAYHRALRFWPEYGERQYFNAELAGILFEARRYKLSRTFYARAVEQNATDDLQCLYADALFFCGEYLDAIQIWDQHANAPEWQLKCHCGKFLVETLGVTSQVRRPIEARSENDWTTALQLDGLDPRAWWNQAQNLLEAGDPGNAAYAFLLSAFSSRLDREAWLNALACAHNANEGMLMTAVLSVGMTWFGEEFFVDFLGRMGPPDDDELRQLAMQAMQAHDEGNAKTLTLRFHEWDPKYDLVATREVTLGEADELQMPDE